MKIKIGIIGLPNIGKSTLFNILTNSKIKNENFPFCTIKPNNKYINIYDKKTKYISNITKSKKIVNIKIKFIDIAGIIKGASKGLGLGNKFLKDIKKTNILIHVIRIFKNNKIINIYKNIDPIRDINILNDEMILSDIEQLEKKKKKEKDKKKIETIEKYINLLLNNKNIISKKNNINKITKKLNLLSIKKQIFILNINNKNNDKYLIKKTKEYIIKKKKNKYIISINIKKINKKKRDKIINKIKKISYKLLKLINFFTTNKKETRIWITKKNNNILKIAKKIHSDFMKYFIKVEIINYKIFIKLNGWKKAKKKGKIKIKGKNYKIKNNDIIHFLINKSK